MTALETPKRFRKFVEKLATDTNTLIQYPVFRPFSGGVGVVEMDGTMVTNVVEQTEPFSTNVVPRDRIMAVRDRMYRKWRSDMKIHLFLLTLVMALSYVYGGLASFTGIVVDADTGRPIENAKVRAIFSNRATKFFESGTSDSYWDFTDKDGRVSFSKWTTKGEAGWGAWKVKGYYGGWGG